MSEVTRKVFHCDRCGWEWIPDSSKVSERCPNRKCRTRKWNVAVPTPERPAENVMMLYNSTCPKCGSATVTWGSMQVRCLKCGVNYPL